MSVCVCDRGVPRWPREDINTVHWTLERCGAIYCNFVQFTFFLTLYFWIGSITLKESVQCIARRPAYLYFKLCLFVFVFCTTLEQSVQCRARRPGQPTDGFWPSQLTAHGPARGQVSTSSASFSQLLPFSPSGIITSQFRHHFHLHHWPQLYYGENGQNC